MAMSPAQRRFALLVHVTLSIGWTGAVAAYLALALAGAGSEDAALVRACYIAMDLLARSVIVPLAVGATLTGLAMGLGTPWGLFRHYWVLVSMLLTLLALAVLLQQLGPIEALAAAARDPTLARADLPGAAGQVLHSAGGLGVLLVVQALNVYKPRGVTPHGWRKQREERARAQPRVP